LKGFPVCGKALSLNGNREFFFTKFIIQKARPRREQSLPPSRE
jgi:hypothetical protein